MNMADRAKRVIDGQTFLRTMGIAKSNQAVANGNQHDNQATFLKFERILRD